MMQKKWEDIKWIFESDGLTRDIYVQETSADNWSKLIKFLNENYIIKFGLTEDNKTAEFIDESQVFNYFNDKSGEAELKFATIKLHDAINVNCHFFLVDEIEFDVDPREIKSLKQYLQVEDFMNQISALLDREIILTDENQAAYPLIKIDTNRGVNWVMKEDEVEKYFGKPDLDKMNKFMKEIEENPEEFRQKLMDSATQSHTASNKKNNKW